MSDMASALLFVQKEESAAYVCFCALMRRLYRNFTDADQLALITKMQHLHDLLVYTDPDLARFLREYNCANMFFAQRWLLLELKREFEFDEALTMMEVQWSTISTRVSLNNGYHERSLNSKSSSGGYLVLAEEDHFNFICTSNDLEENSKCYAVLDVELINSLIGDEYAVEISKSPLKVPKKLMEDGAKAEKLELNQLGFSTDEATSSDDSCESQARRPTQDYYSCNASGSPSYAPLLDSTIASKISTSENYQSEGLMTAIDLENNEVFPTKEADYSKADPKSETGLKRSVSRRKSSSSKSRRRKSSLFESDPVQMKDWVVELPPPDQMGMGNPFLLFLCLSLILEYRKELMETVQDVSDIIMFYLKKKKNHDALSILNRARNLYDKYSKDQEMKSRSLYIMPE